MVDEWHAPGLGEVHNEDHTKIIYCETAGVVDDELAHKICDLLNQHTEKPGT